MRARGRLTGSCLLAATLFAATGCAAPQPAAHPVEIVVTTNILGDVASEIVGDAATVTTLMAPNADPHSFEISAQQAARMDRADLVVSNGLGLEEGLQHHLDRTAAAGVAQFVAGDAITALGYARPTAVAGENAVGRDDDSAHGADPHFWTDPAQMIAVADALVATIAALPGLTADTRATIEQHGHTYRTELRALDARVAHQLAQVPPEQRTLVTNHHVFGYFAARYGYRILGTAVPGASTLAAPSAADLHDLARAIRDANVRTIFAESSAPDRLMLALAQESGIEVQVVELFTESLTTPGGDAATYIDMIEANTTRIVDGLLPR